MLKLYNTLTKEVEEVKSANGDHLNLYTCGPTVYNYAHIGNLRSFIMADLLYRTLKENGYNPRWVMNITDVDDKTIKGAIEKFGAAATVEHLRQFTEEYYKAFVKDLTAVGVAVEEIRFIKITDVIPQIQEFILDLMDKGYAYQAEDGSVYFSIEKYQNDFGDYGQLVGEKFIEGKKVGARVKVDEYEKDNLSDFALWKAHTPEDANIFWDHEKLGKGRPGWHIECSVINQVAFADEVTDIHTGGIDLVFPHHTNEIAQSQPMQKPFVNYWVHGEHLLVDGKKMSKSLLNVFTLKDIEEKGFTGLDFRYFLLSSHYRNQQNFTWEGLLAAKTSRDRFQNIAIDEQYDTDAHLEKVNNDLNFSEALGEVWEQGRSSSGLELILGVRSSGEPDLDVPANIHELLEKRELAKSNKDFAASDELRNQIDVLGYEVMDTPEGQKIKKKIVI
jgi:cysteinyl-tRNA synthetase